MGRLFTKSGVIYSLIWLCIFGIAYYCVTTKMMIPYFNSGEKATPAELNKNLFDIALWHWSTYTNTEDGIKQPHMYFYGIIGICALFALSFVISIIYTIKCCRFLFSGMSLIQSLFSITVLWIKRIFECWKYENKLLFVSTLLALPTIVSVCLAPIFGLFFIYLVHIAPTIDAFYKSTTNTAYWHYHWGAFQAPLLDILEFIAAMLLAIWPFTGFLLADALYKKYKHIFAPQ